MANYVKFMRGTITAFNLIPDKNDDTLYFIYEDETSNSGKLYLGEKLISGNATNSDVSQYLKDLLDVDTTEAADGNILTYDIAQQKWVAADVDSIISNVWNDINSLKETLGQPQSDSAQATGIYAELNKKANSEDIYNKSQIDILISGINSLQRKKVNSIEEINVNAEDADKYIYIVPFGDTEGNRYEEYIVIEGTLEKIGSIGTSAGEVNIINSINVEEFSISEDGKRTLNLKAVPAVKITGIENNETIKIIQADVATLKSSNESIINRLDTIETNVSELQANSTWGTL